MDTHHGVCHAQFLENVADLIADGGFLGSWSLLREMREFQLYEAACEYANARQPHAASIVLVGMSPVIALFIWLCMRAA